MSQSPESSVVKGGFAAVLGHRTAVLGFFLFAVFAPHSIAGAEISLAIVASGWLLRTVATGRAGLRRTKLDLPIWLFLLWTVVSAFMSAEPRISLAKLQSVCVVFVFYLTQAIVTRRTAVLLVSLMILSGVAGTLFSVYDLIRGRGVVVESLSTNSPFRKVVTQPGLAESQLETTEIRRGETIWRIDGHRVYSVAEIDDAIRLATPGKQLPVSVIGDGEHVEWGFVVSPELQKLPSPSGINGAGRLHRFRASGWTRHYEYFAEILQLLAQLSLGLALANFQNHGTNRRFKLALIATGALAFGIAFTAMRTVLVAFAIGGCVVVWRAAARTAAARLLVTAAIMFVFSFGVVVVWQTRATHALSLQDDSSSLRLRVARVGLSRLLLHPVFGHGMDAVQKHWSEWGFPGADMVHFHSTPLQLAFDRGLPALLFWIWIMIASLRLVMGGERMTRDSGDTNRHGVLLGATGALAGFLVSSLVNYNFGAGIVALVFWWFIGVVVVLGEPQRAKR